VSRVFFTLAGLIVAVACTYASVRRIGFAAELTALDPKLLLAAIRGSETRDSPRFWGALRAEISALPGAAWERELLSALALDGASRVALVNEQLSELDHRSQRWARVPRVCASVSTSFGFLLAALAMRAGLAVDTLDVSAGVTGAVNALTFGIAGTAFCVAAQSRARSILKERLAATDKLVERLEALPHEVLS
jgi:hypothetical protein